MGLLFCYGTLKRGYCRNAALSPATFLGKVTTKPKYMLFDVGSFPALTEHPDGVSVKGELYDVPDSLWERLDLIEASPYLYLAKPIEIEGIIEPVKAYFYQLNTSTLTPCGEEWNDSKKGKVEEAYEATGDADGHLRDLQEGA